MSTARRRQDLSPAWPIVAFTLLGAAIRGWDLGGSPLWLDENATFLSLLHLWDQGGEAPIFVQSSNPLYYTLLWGWTQLAGDSVTALRAFSALAGTACIPVGAALGRQLGGLTAGRIAALLIALHPLQIHYSREARAYALWTLALLVAATALRRAVLRGTVRSWGLAAFAWVAAFGVHVFTAFALPATAACVLWARNRPQALRRWLVWSAGLTALAVGYVVIWLRPVLNAGAGSWLRPEDWDPIGSLFASAWALLPAGAYPDHLAQLSAPSGATLAARGLDVGVALFPLVLVPFALAALPRPLGGPSDWRPLAALAVGPIALEWLVSWWTPVYLPGRYDLLAWGPATLCVALGVASLGRDTPPRRQRWIQRGAALTLALCAAVPIGRILATEGPGGWDQQRALRLSELAQEGDLIITFSNDDDAMAHTLAITEFPGTLRPFPRWLARQIAFTDSARDLSASRRVALARDATRVVQRVRRTLAGGGRVFWLSDALRLAGRGARAQLVTALERELRSAGLHRQAVDTSFAIDRLQPF